MTPRFRRPLLHLLALGLLATPGGCGDDASTGPADEIAFLVGDWEASRFLVRNAADPGVAPDLVALGATFTMNVQPSGQYTAVLTFQAVPNVQIGEITVDGGDLVLRVLQPCCRTDRAAFSQAGDGSVTLEGPTTFDFNLDGQPEAAEATIVLVPRA